MDYNNDQGLFGGIEKAQFTQGGVYVEPGLYTAEVKRCRSGRNRKGIGFFLVELEVVESTNGERPAGSTMTWYVGMDKDAALGNVKHFVCAATGCAESEVDAPGVAALCGEDNPLAGLRLHIEAVGVKTRAGNPFTKVIFSKSTGPRGYAPQRSPAAAPAAAAQK